MSDEAGFLAAIAAQPDEDTPRLALADWLDEHDRCAEAELIRVQCALEPIRDRHGEPRTDELWDRERELAWALQCEEWERLKALVGERADDVRVIFRRGLVDALALPVQWLISHGGTLREWYPTLRRFVAFRVNGWGARLAACPHLAGLPELDLPGWYAHEDCVALAHSEHLADLEVLSYWRAGANDEDSTEQLCTFADMAARSNLRKLRVVLGTATDEPLVNDIAGRPIAEVIDPSTWLFPFPADFRSGFFAGRAAGDRLLFAHAPDDKDTGRAVLFDANGNELEQRDVWFPPETIFPAKPRLVEEEENRLRDEYRERRIRILRDTFGFEPGFIRVKQFWLGGDIGPERLSGRIEDMIGYVDNPSTPPETDIEGALGVSGEVYDWITRKNFEFWYDWWCDERGHVTST